MCGRGVGKRSKSAFRSTHTVFDSVKVQHLVVILAGTRFTSLGCGELVGAPTARKAVGICKQDAEKGKFPLKMRDEAIGASIALLKSPPCENPRALGKRVDAPSRRPALETQDYLIRLLRLSVCARQSAKFSVSVLRPGKGLFPDKDDDSEDDMVFGDDDFPCG